LDHQSHDVLFSDWYLEEGTAEGAIKAASARDLPVVIHSGTPEALTTTARAAAAVVLAKPTPFAAIERALNEVVGRGLERSLSA
jgi:hypothetical protein